MARSYRLRTEILLTLTFLLGAALLLGGALFLRLTEQSLLEERLARLEIVANTLANVLTVYSVDNASIDRVQTLRDLIQKRPDKFNHDGWRLYDENLKLLAMDSATEDVSGGVARRQQVKLTLEPVSLVSFPSLLDFFGREEAKAHFVEPIFFQNQFSGLLELRFSLDDIRYHVLRIQKIILIYVFLYGIVLVSIGYYLLQRNIIRPARNLLHATEQVEHGNLDVTLPVAGPVEIAQLAEAYNQMVDALLHSRQETKEQICALEQTNSKLQEARDELVRSEKLASIGQLAAGLAHELGNPLAALIGYLEVLQAQMSNDGQLDILRRSINEAQRIDFLVRELLDFSRPTDVVVDEVDPVVELKKGLDLLKHQGVFSQINVVDNIATESALVRIDRNKLQQVYVNIFLNAAQACAADGVITVSTESCEDMISIVIADNGCGIKKEEIMKIFNPFFTTKNPGEGTGLGLAICQRIIDEAGGKISVASTEKKGSEFKIDFKKTHCHYTTKREIES